MRMYRVFLSAAAIGMLVGCVDEVTTPSAPDESSQSPAGSARSRNALVLAPSFSRAALNASGHSPAIIDNSVVQLGVFPEGHLNVPGGPLSTGLDPTTHVGLRYLATGSDATAPGCLCEGWGAADALTGVTGYANEDWGGAHNLEVESFTRSASTAVSTVLIRNVSGTPWMRVTHDYHPSPATPNLYEVTVTVQNLSGQAIDLRYRRVMDWDIAPNTFHEYSTIQGTAGAEHVIYASNDGFASAIR